MATKYTIARHAQADQVLRDFIAAAHASYGSDAYAAGYLNSSLSTIVAEHLSKAEFAKFITAMQFATIKQVAEADAAAKYKLAAV